MKFTIQQITDSRAEEVLVKCCDSQAAWVEKVRKVVSAQNTVGVYKNGAFYRLELSDIYYFEVVDGNSFIYGNSDVYVSHEKLYEFEKQSQGMAFFRCSKSMVLNADKIEYIKGRFEAVLTNGETVIVSRKYVSELKRLLGM
mgnify:FL=1